MPAHDWSLVDDGVFHHFHQEWVREISRTLNDSLLPDGYYALTEQFAAGFNPDVVTLQALDDGWSSGSSTRQSSDDSQGGTAVLVESPKVALWGECETESYLRKQDAVVVRHSSDDQVVALVEVVSRGNKSSNSRLQAFVKKVSELLHQQIHQLVLDLHPPGTLDPLGLHAVIWEYLDGEFDRAKLPPKPLQMMCYEADITTRAYLASLSVGESLPVMPLFLRPGAHVEVPLEETYQRAFAGVPRRWRTMLESVTR